MYRLSKKEIEERKSINYLNAVIQDGLISKINDIELAVKIMIEKYNDISEIQINYNDYKVFYIDLTSYTNYSLKKIIIERTKVLETICNMRNNLINPVIKLTENEQEILLNDPEENFEIKRNNLYINTKWCDDPLPF